jgi:2-keto-4-pentenoate hydratase/2-oxohepta-3-ene-1,7-dioic acid hydratase in catechol pathway
MRLVSFEVKTPLGPVRRIGALAAREEPHEGSQIIDLTAGYSMLLREGGEPLWREIGEATMAPDMVSFLKGGAGSRTRAQQVLDFAAQTKASPDDAAGQLVYARSEVKLLAPVPRPTTLHDFSVYQTHMTAHSRNTEKAPQWYFFPPGYKGNPTAIYGPDDPMLWPDYSEFLDPELEPAIYVCSPAGAGKTGRNITPEEAKEYIGGYTILIDMSARDIHAREIFGPFKSKDFGSIMGPCMVTPDEFDETNARCSLRVNGETWWEGNTGETRNYLLTDLVAYVSDGETLNPGDAIAAGTVGMSCSIDTDRWVKPGDVVEHWIEGIGTIRTVVQRENNPKSYVRGGMLGRVPVPDSAKQWLENVTRNRPLPGR